MKKTQTLPKVAEKAQNLKAFAQTLTTENVLSKATQHQTQGGGYYKVRVR